MRAESSCLYSTKLDRHLSSGLEYKYNSATMPTKSTQKLIAEKKIENLLNQQTTVILDAVDHKITGLEERITGFEERTDKRFVMLERRIMILEKRIDNLEIRINQKLDRLATILDGFLKKLTDMEDEFVFMKADVKRIKAVLKEKLGVDLE